MNISLELGSPFKPFNQLLGVFPAASGHALPEHYRKLMMDPNSPIIDFYPTDFEVDMNGKRYYWQAEEVSRNRVMLDMLFVFLAHPLSPYIFSLDDRCKQLTEGEQDVVKERLDARASGGMNGYLPPCGEEPCPPIFHSPINGMEDIVDNQIICAIFRLPDAHKHIARPSPGVIFPKKTVTVDDVKPDPVLWHEESGRRPLGNGSNNIPGNISGRQLREAAHRLVVNSLQAKHHRNGYEDRSYESPTSYPGPHGLSQPSHSIYHYQAQNMRMPQTKLSSRFPW